VPKHGGEQDAPVQRARVPREDVAGPA